MDVQSILHKFGIRTRSHRASLGRHTDPVFLKFDVLNQRTSDGPLSKGKTLDLIQQMERHKATCTMAHAGDGLMSIHSVLMETKFSYEHLIEIQAKQDRIPELQLDQGESQWWYVTLCLPEIFAKVPR